MRRQFQLQTLRLSFCLLALSCWSLVAVAQEATLEAHAKRLLDTPLLQRGDKLTTALEAIDVLETPGAEPLAEAAVRLLRERADGLFDRRILIERLDALDPSRFPAAARRELEQFLGYLRRDFVLDAGVDAFPSYLSEFRVLGPLPPRFETGAVRRVDALAEELAQSPDFDRERNGIDGSLPWVELRRSPAEPYVSPINAVLRGVGLSVLATSFVHSGGGPAWLEISASFPVGMRHSVGAFPSDLPGFGISWNESPFEFVDCRAPQRPVVRVPIMLRDGVNRLLLRSSLDSRLRARIALRVLEPSGDPIDVGGFVDGPLGTPVEGAPPELDPFGEVVGLLERLRSQGAHLEALLGAVRTLENDQAGGLEALESAVRRAPEALYLKGILALATDRATYLPEAWRRGRARELAQQVAAADPTLYMIQQFLASALAGEDREEEALAKLDALAIRYPESADIQRHRWQILDDFGLGVMAERALQEAHRLAPDSVDIMAELAEHWGEHGQGARAARLDLEAARRNGNISRDLQQAAVSLEKAGLVREALELRREIFARYPLSWEQLVTALIDLEELEEARRITEAFARRYPKVEGPAYRLADILLRQGELEAHETQLRAALALDPSSRVLRERLASLGGRDDATKFFEEGLIEAAGVLEGYDDMGSEESTVLVIDHAMTWYFEDGSSERVTQNLFHARDLDGCEALGTIGVEGDLLSLAVIKQGTGERFEPIEVAGEYVLPSLRPGDFVELIWRETSSAPADGVHSPSAWYFASVEQPFHLSRFVLTVPDSLPLRVVQKRMDGLVATSESRDGRTLHRFESNRMPRVLLEPGAPPVDWILPLVAVGSDESLAGIADYHLNEAAWCSTVRPEIQRVVDEIMSETREEAQLARELHSFVSEHIDKRAWSPTDATRVLLGREGNPTFLYLALLRAAGIEHELVWARGASPEEDSDPEPDFLEFDRWRQRPLVRVEPAGAEPAWCDMSIKLLPYGVCAGVAPGAEALRPRTREQIRTPSLALEERPGVHLDATIRVAEDGSAEVEADCRFAAILGYQLKEQVRDLPENARLYNLRGIASQLMRGFEVRSYELPGLDSPDEPMEIHVEGHVRAFLDREAGGWACNLPVIPLQMSADFGGEGTRRLPFFLSRPHVGSLRVRIELPEGLELVDGPQPLALECAGGGWRLGLSMQQDGSWLLERRVGIRAFQLEAAEYPAFLEFCAAVDNAERGRLRFRRP